MGHWCEKCYSTILISNFDQVFVSWIERTSWNVSFLLISK